MTVYRCYVEKRPEYAVEAGGVASTLSTVIRSGNVKAVRILNRYDLEGIEEADYEKACSGILSEPQVDTLYHETAPAPDTDEWVLAVEYLPGQFDQRADSAAQCIQLMTCKTRPDVRTARIYYIKGALTEDEKAILTDWILGQNSDGYGEHFEQQPIKTDEGDLYVSFWNSGDDYRIMDRDELDGFIDGQSFNMGGM